MSVMDTVDAASGPITRERWDGRVEHFFKMAPRGWTEAGRPYPRSSKRVFVSALTIQMVHDLNEGEVMTVPLASLIATQKFVNEETIEAFAHCPNYDRGLSEAIASPILVIKIDGSFWIFDGHHRAVAAVLRGETIILARVYRE